MTDKKTPQPKKEQPSLVSFAGPPPARSSRDSQLRGGASLWEDLVAAASGSSGSRPPAEAPEKKEPKDYSELVEFVSKLYDSDATEPPISKEKHLALLAFLAACHGFEASQMNPDGWVKGAAKAAAAHALESKGQNLEAVIYQYARSHIANAIVSSFRAFQMSKSYSQYSMMDLATGTASASGLCSVFRELIKTHIMLLQANPAKRYGSAARFQYWKRKQELCEQYIAKSSCGGAGLNSDCSSTKMR